MNVRSLLFVCLFLHAIVAVAAPTTDGLVESARGQIGVTLAYDPTYRVLPFPGGDVPLAVGVCTDVVIRALREQGLDLQAAVNQDMRKNFSAYPQKWGLRRPDSNIDHRRVPNLMAWFNRQGYSRPASQTLSDYEPGDVVTWSLGRGLTHIGIVSDRRTLFGVPLIIHNIGAGTKEENLLFSHEIIGHYRMPERFR